MTTAAQTLIRALVREGVDTLFTLTGGHILPLLDACVAEGVRLVDVRHEQAAAHAADAYARLTGRLGVAAVTAGPGATDAVTGVAAAWNAASPILLLVGRHPQHEDLRGGLQEMEHPPIFERITRWTHTARDPDRLAEVAATAIGHAYANRGGPVVLDIPWDVQAAPVRERPAGPGALRPNRPAAVDPDTVAEVAGLLAASSRPVVFAGTGLRWSRVDVPLAEVTAAGRLPLFLNSLARGAVRWDHPTLGNRARSWALGRADLVVALGVDWDFRTRFGEVVGPRARVVHVDAEPTRVGWNRPVDIGVAADPGVFVGQLLGEAGRFARTSDTDWLTEVRGEEARREAEAVAAAASDASPVHPERFAREVADFFGEDTIVAADGGDIVSTTAKWLRTSAPGHLLDPGPFGCLGVGAPFALAAKVVHPETRVGVVFGDGAFGFNGMEYDSLVRHELPVVGVVGNDGVWNNIKVLHRALFPDRVVAADLGIRPYHAMVEALGGYGEFVDRPEDLRPALERAHDSGLPALVNVHIAEQLRPSSVYGFSAG